jgi:hypothetical protein
VISLANPDPGLTRPYVDQFNLGATREIMRGVSVSGEWFHNDSKNPFERNNVLRPGTYDNGKVSNAAYRPVTIFSPIDGTPVTMYDVLQPFATLVQNVDTNDSRVKQSYNAFEFNFNARLPHGARLFGGSATDRTVANTCGGAATNPNFLVTIGGVTTATGRTADAVENAVQARGHLPLPWYGLQFAASFRRCRTCRHAGADGRRRGRAELRRTRRRLVYGHADHALHRLPGNSVADCWSARSSCGPAHLVVRGAADPPDRDDAPRDTARSQSASGS